MAHLASRRGRACDRYRRATEGIRLAPSNALNRRVNAPSILTDLMGSTAAITASSRDRKSSSAATANTPRAARTGRWVTGQVADSDRPPLHRVAPRGRSVADRRRSVSASLHPALCSSVPVAGRPRAAQRPPPAIAPTQSPVERRLRLSTLPAAAVGPQGEGCVRCCQLRNAGCGF
jgi:hypothetical protein